jgi:teichuronic acid biosynthesis glycosyltransferase TuaG
VPPVCSVVIPVYNSSKTLEACLRSALTQSFCEIEIIIVDDGSTDGSEAVYSLLAHGDPRMRCIKRESNMGVAAARNAGVAAARGEWLAFLDSDDYWKPEKLERQLELIRKSGAEFVFTAAECIGSDGQKSGRVFHVPDKADFETLLLGNVIVCSSVLIKKSLLLEYPMSHTELHEDYICWLRILKGGSPALGINEPLTVYRLSQKSKSGNKLKSAVMTWKSYGIVGIPFIKRVRCFFAYTLHGLRRHA